MNRTMIAAACLAALILPARAGGYIPPPGESCPTLAESIADARLSAAQHHASVAFLDDEQAHRFLVALVPLGAKLQVTADHVAVFLELDLDSGFVRVADGLCGGYGSQFITKPDNIRAALAAALR